MHREGIPTIAISTIVWILCVLWAAKADNVFISILAFAISVVYFIILYFFRNPTRTVAIKDDHNVLSPCDGKVVVIEKVIEKEYFKDERILVSIFMSPLNVHVNRAPISGTYDYAKYHPGKFLVAWHPKSSEENERTSIAIKGKQATIFLRQVAGALARRIVMYAQSGQSTEQGDELGFIKFGSRVDLYLPLDADIQVSLEDKVAGNRSVIARLS